MFRANYALVIYLLTLRENLIQLQKNSPPKVNSYGGLRPKIYKQNLKLI